MKDVEHNAVGKKKDCQDIWANGKFIGFNTQDSSRQIQRALD